MKRVLLVDDAKFMRMILRQLLTQGGYAVVGEASNGQEAVALYQTLSPDLTIMDIYMPQLDGISALQEIKQYDPKAKVIMCTSVSHRQAVISAIQAGAIDFMAKPICRERLLLTVGEVFSAFHRQTDRGIQIS